MLAAIPSVILGFWGIVVLAPFLQEHVEPWLHETLGFIPIFGAPRPPGPASSPPPDPHDHGRFRSSPRSAATCSDRPPRAPDGAEALGATRWEVVRGVVLPTYRLGVIAASLLGLGRALGEAIAVTQVIGAGTRSARCSGPVTRWQPDRGAVPGAHRDCTRRPSSTWRGPAGDRAHRRPDRAMDRPAASSYARRGGAWARAPSRPDGAAHPLRQPAAATGRQPGRRGAARTRGVARGPRPGAGGLDGRMRGAARAQPRLPDQAAASRRDRAAIVGTVRSASRAAIATPIGVLWRST